MRFPHRVAAGAIAVMAASAVSVAVAAPLDRPAVVDLTAFRIDPPDITPWPAEERAGREVLRLVNELRRSQGLAEVEWDPQITLAAQAHSEFMAARSRLGHEGRGGSDAGDRLDAFGVGWLRYGEKIAETYGSPASAFDAWSASASHRDILLGDFETAGVGVAANDDGTPYWTLVLVGNEFFP